MRLSISFNQAEKDSSHWASLPVLCCQAAGGKPLHTEPVAAAWFLFYMAAGIMDSVEDRDAPAPWWAESGPGMALSVATGLYFSGNLALNHLEKVIGNTLTARQVREEILSGFLEMGAGQHLDITLPRPNMDQYWQIARAKSGSFFAMACWAGARIAIRQRRKLDGYHQFGMNVGLLIQVLDDLHDYLQLNQLTVDPASLDLNRSLPAVYVREVAPEPIKNHFETLLSSKKSPETLGEIFETIEQYGGVLYLYTELDRLYQSALTGLNLAKADQPAKGQLIDLLDELLSNK
jgi:competence protein ComQ